MLLPHFLRKPALFVSSAMLLMSGLLACSARPSGPASSPEASPTSAPAIDAEVETPKEPPSLLGVVTREQLAMAEPGWVAAEIEAEIDPMQAMAFGEVPEGAEVEIYFGTWCSDSKRELARFFRALDEAGGFTNFDFELIAVDRRDERRPEILDGQAVYWVPTFIVRRDGEEVGRVVESASTGIESDLVALLNGEASGVLTGREDGARLEGQEPPTEPKPEVDDEVLFTPTESGAEGEG